jgi:hypothetical protein
VPKSAAPPFSGFLPARERCGDNQSHGHRIEEEATDTGIQSGMGGDDGEGFQLYS